MAQPYSSHLTSTGTMYNLLMSYYDRLLLDRLEASIVLAQFAEKRPLPKNAGTTITFNRYADIQAGSALSAAKLTEGTAPTPINTSSTVVSATLEQYGGFAQPSDVLVMTAIDNQIESLIELFGYHAARTIDTRILEGLYGTSASVVIPAKLPAFWWAGTSTNINTLSSLNGDMKCDINNLRQVAFQLRRLNVRPFDDGYYVMVAHPNTVSSLESDSNWRTWNQYQAKDTMWKGEVGNIFGIKVIESTQIKSTTSGTGTPGTTAAYFSPVFGKGAYAVTELDGGVKTYIKNPSESDTSNPLNQWSTVGWKATFATQVLNNSCGVILITAD